jgi:hypothetical protein
MRRTLEPLQRHPGNQNDCNQGKAQVDQQSFAAKKIKKIPHKFTLYPGKDRKPNAFFFTLILLSPVRRS